MDSIWQSMAQASVSDWVWHILAIIPAVYLSVPGLWWPYVEKYRKKRAEKLRLQQTQEQEQEQAKLQQSNS